VPHKGFAWLMSRIKWQMSAATSVFRDAAVISASSTTRKLDGCQAFTLSGEPSANYGAKPGHIARARPTRAGRSAGGARDVARSFAERVGDGATEREDLRLQGDTSSKTGGYQNEKGDGQRAHRDATRIS
jgi:hypothetical protein